MSAPALKARPPAPVRTIERVSPRSSSSHTRARSAIMPRVMALSRGWLSIVTTATCALRCSSRISMRLAPVRDDDDLAVRLAIGEAADGLGRALERQAIGDQRAQLALAVPAQQLLHRARELVGRVPAEVAQRGAERRTMLHQQAGGPGLLDPAPETDQQEAPAPTPPPGRGVEE